ncbi:MFS transporter [Flavihumibacter petaseus]|uniref:Putative major facilitator superfamily transporter n=1 Tax=Flavihumibacter petaseus NBRC 106054 TaxID=1220578 RepID=A0A0E9N184_9BACT|nr:MFS transporter [Flavihumibacter petaseus]GAO43396.1 putative major facilitator superfamily transporter [Flavihumibacter petaseus NBRC 106054]
MQTEAISGFTPYQRFIIAILGLLQFTIVLDFMIISPLGDILMKSLDINTAQFGLIVSAYAFSAAISGIMAAGFADRFDRKKLLLFFYTGFLLGTVSCGMADSFTQLLAARIVTGLFGGVIGAVSLAIVADLFRPDQRGRVMSVIQMGFAGSQVLGIPLGLFLANRWTWHATFLMIAAFGLLIGLAVLLNMQPVTAHLDNRTDKNPLLHLWHTLLNKRYQTGFLATTFLPVGGFMLMPFGSAFIINNLLLTQEDLPLIFMLSGISSIIIMPMIGRLSDRVDRFKLFAAGSVLSMIMVLIYTHLPPVPLWLLIMVNMIMFMGIMSRIIPAVALNTSIPEMHDRGAYMSISASLQQMAGGVAAMAAGLIVFQPHPHSPIEHYPRLGWVVTTVVLVCIWLVYRVSLIVKQPATK